MKIRPEIISEWQRYCVANPNGELTIDTADGIEILKVYSALHSAPEFRVERAPTVGKCVRVMVTWEVGERVKLIRLPAYDLNGRRLRKSSERDIC